MQHTLTGDEAALNEFENFQDKVSEELSFTKDHLATMQVNIGRLCNLACKHCHIVAGPQYVDEVMSKENLQNCLDVFTYYKDFEVLDITGGAPEMNPHFEWFIKEAHKLGIKNIMVRSNLSILVEDEYKHLPELYRDLGITIVASLPYFTEEGTDSQRGKGVFSKEVQMIRVLNDLGYGKDPSLQLNLVHNPRGAYLPASQTSIEHEFKEQLKERYDIVFNNLFVITNNSIGRFGTFLQRSDNLEDYMDDLIGAFNPATVEGLMCRNQISVKWTGEVYDCDFNLAIELPQAGITTIAELNAKKPESLKREIAFANHCYGCTAGAGSSCGGTTA